MLLVPVLSVSIAKHFHHCLKQSALHFITYLPFSVIILSIKGVIDVNTMKISSVLFLHFTFLTLFNGLLSFNPESVIVQSHEDDDKRTEKFQMEDRQEKTFMNEEEPRIIVRKFMRPFRIGPTRYWREVRREYVVRRQNSSPLQNFRFPEQNSRRTTEKGFINDKNGKITSDNKSSILSDNSNNQSNSRMATKKSNINVNSEPTGDGIKSQMPPNRIKGNNKNNHENSKTINSSPATTESEEEYFEDEDPENAVNKLPGRISPDSNFFAGIVNDFAFKLTETLNLESNFVISPLSIFVALSMCYLGSDGRTKAQMEQALGMDHNAIHGEHLHQGIKDLLSLMLKDSRGYKLFVANGMFLGQNVSVNAHFEQNIKKYYDAELKNLDFGDAELSLRFINDWVTQNTESMITSIIDSPPSSLMRLILLNAVYFKGNWKTMFPPHLTTDEKFHLMNGNVKEVPFMQVMDKTFPLFRSDEYKHTFIKLPYEGDQLSMIIALPYTKEQKPMPSVTDEILCHIRDAMEDTNLRIVSIPKFRLEYGQSLKQPLQKLGINDIFNRNAADLRKLTNESVYVSEIMHKAVVQVNEVGTTASAITSIFIMRTSARKVFAADHPFAFYIVHEASGLVLFYGKVFDSDAIPRGN